MKKNLQFIGLIIAFCFVSPLAGIAQYLELSTTTGSPVVAEFDKNEDGEWIHWDSGENTGNSIGTNNPAIFSIAHRWEPADLAPYDEMLITKVRFFPRYPIAAFTVKIWTGADATEVYSQLVDTFTNEAWNEIDLDTPFEIDASIDLWYGVHINTQGGYPAGCDAGPEVAGKGNMIHWEGNWYELNDLNEDLTFNWNLGAYVVEGEPGDTYEVTFNLDMTDAVAVGGLVFDPDIHSVFITGSFADWPTPGTDDTFELQPLGTREPGDELYYTLTLPIEEGQHEYLYFFIEGEPGWDYGEGPGSPLRTIYVENDMIIYDTWGVIDGEPVFHTVTFNVDDQNEVPLENAKITVTPDNGKKASKKLSNPFQKKNQKPDTPYLHLSKNTDHTRANASENIADQKYTSEAFLEKSDTWPVILYTNANGQASFDALDGNYSFSVENDGFITVYDDFTVSGQDVNIHVSLNIEAVTPLVTFNVNMADADNFNPALHQVFISGSFAGWATPGEDEAFELHPANKRDPGNDMIYTLALEMEAGVHEYKYFLVEDNPTWDFGEWDGDPNRYIFVANDTVFHDTWAVIDMDEDEPDFPTVVIGEQEWMAENLKVTHYQNGDPIPDGTGLGWTWPDQDYYFMVNDDPDLVDTYGLLYTGFVVKDEREVCPAGWTVPTNAQWQVMEMQLGMSWKVANVWGVALGHGHDEGGKLKATGTEYWNLPNVGATDEFGFSVLPAGYRSQDFMNQGQRANFLTSTPVGNSLRNRFYYYNHPRTFHGYWSQEYAQSIRCIKIQANQTVPGVISGNVSEVEPSSAKVEGSVTSSGNATVVARGIAYGTSPELVVENISFSYDGSGTGSFTGELIDLLPGTTYYARAYAVNANGINYGDQVSFTTPSANIPQLSNVTGSDIEQTSVYLSSEVTHEGESSVNSRGFVWSQSYNPTLQDDHIEVGDGPGEFSAQVTGLLPNTHYFVRAYASNTQGTSYSNWVRFHTQTDKPMPTIVTLDVDQVTTNSAVVTANVTDDGGAEILERGIRIYQTGDYGGYYDIPVEGGMGEFTLTLTDLEANTDYSVRGYAANENGFRIGNALNFRTMFANAEQAQDVMNDIYHYMFAWGTVPFGGHDNFGVKSFDLTSDLMGEDMVVHSTGHGWFNAHYRYIAQANKSSTLVRYTWLRFYEMIEMANFVAAHIDQAAGAQVDKDRVKAQALAMRAFSHFQLVQAFSNPFSYNPDAPGIPYLTENDRNFSSISLSDLQQRQKETEILINEWESRQSKEAGDSRPGRWAEPGILERGKVSDVYDHLVADLDMAVSLFENTGTQQHRSHIDLAVAQGLRARVALAMEDWDAAAGHADQAITTAETAGRSLYSPDQYNASGFNSVEGSEWLWGSEITEYNHTGFGSFFSHMDARFQSYANMGLQKKITAELYNSFPATDVRRDLFITPATGEGPLVDYNQMKFLTKNIGSFVADYLYMRLSEMYLIRAEAQAKGSGSDADASQSLFELVSQRDPQYSLSTNTGQDLVDEILLHRRMELWGEGHRFLDIRRLQQPLDRPSGEGNHDPAFAQVMYLPANDDLFNWRIPFHCYLDIEIAGNGHVEVEGEPYDQNYPPLVAYGSEVMLHATPAEGHVFLNWEEDGETISTQAGFIYTFEEEDVALTANFQALEYTLNILVQPEEAGEVTMEPDQEVYHVGDEITLTATANDGYKFQNWRKDGVVISDESPFVFTMPAQDVTLTAYFVDEDAELFTLTLAINPEDAGQVHGEGQFIAGEEVNVTATANTGFMFISWTNSEGEVVSNEENYSFNMPEADLSLTANFASEHVSTSKIDDKGIQVYPNPARSELNIKSGSEIDKVYMFDISGRTVLIKTVRHNQIRINVHGMEPGIYFFRIITENQVVTRKVIIQN